MAKVISPSGFECEVDENVIASNRFIRCFTTMSSADKEDPADLLATAVKLENMLLGDRIDDLEDHMEAVIGHAPTLPEMINEMTGIIKSAGEKSKEIKKS